MVGVRLMKGYEKVELSEEERTFLHMSSDPISRQFLLDRLEQLELLSAFLEAESGTT